MDWALYKPLGDRTGSNIEPKASKVCRDWIEVTAKAEVYSVGRTSGYQTGVINSSMSYVDFGDHQTEEWAVVKPDWLDEKTWVESGLGVEGDSGAWIIARSTNQLHGMLWGRQGKGAGTVTYFTPTAEIVADIKEKLGEVDVHLP